MLLLALATSLLCAHVSTARAQDTLVIAPDEWRPALAEWTAHRESQGRTIAVEAPGDDVGALVRRVHTKSEGALRFVLLLGDVDRVPCAYRPAVAIAEWEDDDRIATDAPYADLDDDGAPDLAIGRIPAGSADESRAILARSIAYETEPRPGTWRRRLGVFAGVGGFGAQQDMALEMLTRVVLNNDVPASIETSFAYAKETSAFCPPPTGLQDEMLRMLSHGALVVAYVGHGSARHVDRMTWNGVGHPILEADAAQRIDCAAGPALLVFVACTTGRYDGKDDSLAELALRRPAGPAAVIASSRVSTPYGNGILAVELLGALFAAETPTAGELLMETKRKLVLDTGSSRTRKMLDAMASSLYQPDPEKRAVDRREHVLLYQLLGDPLLRLARPEEATVAPPSRAPAGSTVEVLVTSPVAGEALVELLPRRDAFARPKQPGRTLEEFASDHRRANVRPVASASVTLEHPDSATPVTLDIPESLPPGRYQVRVWIESGARTAAGGAMLLVSRPR
jgi:hypothetical protein